MATAATNTFHFETPTNVTTNTSHHPQHHHNNHIQHLQQNNVHVAVFLPAYFFFSYYGNIFLLVALYRTKKKVRNGSSWTPVNIMIANITVANIVITTVPSLSNGLELMLGEWLLGKFFCYLSTSLQYLFQSVSHFSCTAIALQRYRAVANPLREVKWKKRRSTYLITMVWISGVVVAIASTAIHTPGEKVNGVEACFNSWINYPNNKAMAVTATALSTCLYLVPMATITVLYTKLAFILKNRSFPGDLRNEVQVMRRAIENRKIVIMILATVVIFQASWLPTVATQIWVGLQYPGSITTGVYRLETAVTTIAFLYCALMPWVFIFSVASLKRQLLNQFKCLPFCQGERSVNGAESPTLATEQVTSF